MSSRAPNSHIQSYLWEIIDDGRIAIIQHGQQYHVLTACDTVNSLTEAIQRVAELERQFEQSAAPAEQEPKS